MNHDLKEWPEAFGALIGKVRKHEVRFSDREFNIGDTLTIREYIPQQNYYTGRVCVCRVLTKQVVPGMAEAVVSMDIALETVASEEPRTGA